MLSCGWIRGKGKKEKIKKTRYIYLKKKLFILNAFLYRRLNNLKYIKF